MRYPIIIIVLAFPISIFAGIAKNNKPEIFGQKQLSTLEDVSLAIQLSDLYVFDWDDVYPYGFTLQLYSGSNYTVLGNTIVPNADFSGTLTVPITVNDGKNDSRKFDLKIYVSPVNDVPVIVSQRALSIDENKTITIQLADLSVNDPDNNYPNGFTLRIAQGDNYSLSGNTITPSQDFVGTLSASVRVNDGAADSNPFSLKIEVRPVSKVPQIIGQAPLKINEDEMLTIKLADLKVIDADDHYPDGFSFTLLKGTNYTLPGDGVVKPASNFSGNLSVPVTVSDGTHVSEPYNLSITVTAVNDAPEITNIESTSLSYEFGNGRVSITGEFRVIDVDDENLSSGEIRFEKDSYVEGSDLLVFSSTDNIKGVFDGNTGVLSLTGKASLNDYIQAVRSVQFSYASANDSVTTEKKLLFTLSDGKDVSTAAERSIVIGGSHTSDIDVPTGFTPNGDLANDTWSVRPLKSIDPWTKPTIRVYNRFGAMVYEATGFDSEWDGRFRGELLPADTYFYTIDLNLIGSKSTYKGLVTILH
jgi:gliding motility-associated-like protein